MNKRFVVMLSALLSIAFVGTSCGSRVEPTPTTDPNAVMTEVAQTVAAEITAAALLTPSPTATLAPTPTIPATPTQDLTALPTVPTVAVTAPVSNSTAATAPVTTADNLEVLSDVTVRMAPPFILMNPLIKYGKYRILVQPLGTVPIVS